MTNRFQEYYETYPKMVSSPFGGVDGIQADLLTSVFAELGIDITNRKILDVGCGRGFTSEIVAEHGGDYTGADIVVSRTGLRMAMADASRLPFPDATFDGVFCIDAFEHVPRQDVAACEFRRVLRPGGFLFLSVPNYGNVAGIVKKFCEAWGSYEKDTWAPFQNWQPQELEQFVTRGRMERMFKRAGFASSRVMGHELEVNDGLFPWMSLGAFPERLKCYLQWVIHRIGRPLVRVWPGASLHLFFKFEV